MKVLRRITIGLTGVVLITSIILLLNITAPNPTARRYSSRIIQTTGSPQTVGRDAENVLGEDLHLPNNNDPDQRQCICGNQSYANSNVCRICIVESVSIDTYRIPDFVAPWFIAEAKNREGLLYTGREADQISDFALAARMLNRPLWLYVRVDTEVDPQYGALVEATGGGVVRYFATSGYADPVDTGARVGLIVSVAVLGGLAVRAVMNFRGIRAAPPKSPQTPLNNAARVTDRAEAFGKTSRERIRRQLDEQNTRDEFD